MTDRSGVTGSHAASAAPRGQRTVSPREDIPRWMTAHTVTDIGTFADRSDPLLLALARYVQALDERYPEGPDQMRSEGLAGRANILTVMPARGPRG
jgi:hypothetical protein